MLKMTETRTCQQPLLQLFNKAIVIVIVKVNVDHSKVKDLNQSSECIALNKQLFSAEEDA